ncbi:MAG: hypothetical protein HY426_04235 [Candidatus Levybacteria bacterium]|nr:hypothetical protein [Candidatus Levybacteria bacterium]
MNSNPKQIILQVLEIIGYSDDKEKYADDFLALCFQKAFVNLTQKLPQDKQDQLTQRMSLVSADKTEALLLEYFPKEEFENAIKEASRSTFEEYLKTIIPTLNEEQRSKLEAYLSSKSQAAV